MPNRLRYDEQWHLRMRQQAHATLARHVHIKRGVLEVAQSSYCANVLVRDDRPLLDRHMRGTDKIRSVGGRIVPPSEYRPLVAQYLKAQPTALVYHFV